MGTNMEKQKNKIDLKSVVFAVILFIILSLYGESFLDGFISAMKA